MKNYYQIEEAEDGTFGVRSYENGEPFSHLYNKKASPSGGLLVGLSEEEAIDLAATWNQRAGLKPSAITPEGDFLFVYA